MADIQKPDPLVSIIIPTYNRAALIGETIESVRRQTWQHWELIVVDDGSTDNTADLMQQLNDSRITYYRIAHSGSFGVVRNHGITRSKGEFITFLDSDDLWDPQKLRLQLSCFEAEPGTAFVFTHIELFGATGVIVPEYKAIHGEKLLSRYLQEGHFAFYPSTLMFRRSVLQQTGLMDEHLPTGADTDFFLTLCCHFKGSFLAERLVKIRKHDHNTSSSDPLFSYPETVALVQRIYKKGYLTPPLYRATMSKLYYKMGLILKHQRQYKASFMCFLSYSRFKPLHWKGWARLIQTPLDYLGNISR
jgi:glycosyltransferase involved in cell wall biosynthesis